MHILDITVHGTAKPQGSKKAIMGPHQKFPSVIESAGEPLKQWRYSIAQAAAQAMGGTPPVVEAVTVAIVFFMPRPKGHYGSGKNAGTIKATAPNTHTTKPDIDKLTRAVLDSLATRAYRDDSQVVAVHARKEYTDTDPHARIVVCKSADSVAVPPFC